MASQLDNSAFLDAMTSLQNNKTNDMRYYPMSHGLEIHFRKTMYYDVLLLARDHPLNQ